MSVISQGSLFPVQLEQEIFSKVKGHSTLAKLSGSEPLPFVGKDIFTFAFNSHLAIVGENGQKPAGDGVVSTVRMQPVKVVYQSRVSQEFMNASDEYQLNVLQNFADGFAKELGRGLDVMAMHGINPADGTASSIIGTNSLDGKIESDNIITYTAADAASAIDDAVAVVEAAEYACNGCAIAPVTRSDIAKLTASGKQRAYPEFAFGGCPEKLGSMTLDANATVNSGASACRAYVGDFANAFRWGIAKELPIEVIEFGDPDGAGDLKRNNQVVIRSEAFIGWAIMDAAAFAKAAV